MSTIIETDLKEVLNQINGKLDKLGDNVNELKVTAAKLEEGQNGINKRLDNLDFISRTVIGGVILALLAGLAKILYPNLIS
jgi:murein lipoprotein